MPVGVMSAIPSSPFSLPSYVAHLDQRCERRMAHARLAVQAVPRDLVHGRRDGVHERIIRVRLPGLSGSSAVERGGDMEYPPQASYRDIRAKQGRSEHSL